MEIFMNVWLAFNIVFGLWVGRNVLVWCWCVITGGRYSQNTLGQMLNLVTLVSIVAYWLTVT